MVDVIENKYGVSHKSTLRNLIIKSLDANDNETGAVEGANWTAINAAEAVAKLIDLLVEKTVITLDEALDLGGIYHKDITLDKGDA